MNLKPTLAATLFAIVAAFSLNASAAHTFIATAIPDLRFTLIPRSLDVHNVEDVTIKLARDLSTNPA